MNTENDYTEEDELLDEDTPLLGSGKKRKKANPPPPPKRARRITAPLLISSIGTPTTAAVEEITVDGSSDEIEEPDSPKVDESGCTKS